MLNEYYFFKTAEEVTEYFGIKKEYTEEEQKQIDKVGERFCSFFLTQLDLTQVSSSGAEIFRKRFLIHH